MRQKNRNYAIISKAHDSEQNLFLIQSVLQKKRSNPSALVFPFHSGTQMVSQLPDRPYFICHPGSSAQREMHKKRLPPPLFVQFIEKIYKRFDIPCVLLGGPEESELRAYIVSHTPKSCIKIETSNLNELGDVIQSSCFFLGNDSGLMHMAVAAQKRCIVFFGPSDEWRTGPYFLKHDIHDSQALPQRGHLILRPKGSEVSAHPNSNPKLRNGDFSGFDQLDVDESWEKIKTFISRIIGV